MKSADKLWPMGTKQKFFAPYPVERRNKIFQAESFRKKGISSLKKINSAEKWIILRIYYEKWEKP